ncbi:hypothetical protein ABW21_db0206275 [Orbilia brochopaga]|nr:hypothetical protein ABW21_db0206275 [Drechslerella brochopaga]
MKRIATCIPTLTIVLFNLLAPTAAFLYGIVRGDDESNIPPRLDRIDRLGEADCFSTLPHRSTLPRLPNTDLDRRVRNFRQPAVRPADNRVLKFLGVANWFGSPQVQAMKLYSTEGCEAGTVVMIIRWYSRLNVIQIANLVDPSYLDIIPQRILAIQPILDVTPITSDDPEAEADEIDFAAEVIDNPGLMKPGSVYIPRIENNGNGNAASHYCDGIVEINKGVKNTLESLSALSAENQSDDASQFKWLRSYVSKLLTYLADDTARFMGKMRPKRFDSLKFSCMPLEHRAYVPFPGQADALDENNPGDTVANVVAANEQLVSESGNGFIEPVSASSGDSGSEQLSGSINSAASSEIQPPRRKQGRPRKPQPEGVEKPKRIRKPRPRPPGVKSRAQTANEILEDLESIINPVTKNLKVEAGDTAVPQSFWQSVLEQQRQQDEQQYRVTSNPYGMFEPGWSLLDFNPLGDDPMGSNLPTLFDINVSDEGSPGTFTNQLDSELRTYMSTMPAGSFNAFGRNFQMASQPAGETKIEAKEEEEVHADGWNVNAATDTKIEEETF